LPQDPGEAARIQKIAADLGHACALSNLGRCSRTLHRGVSQDSGEAAQHSPNEQKRRSQWRQDEQERQEGAAERQRQRWQENQHRWRDIAPGQMSITQAHEILGIGQDETAQDVRSKYIELIKCLHPDVGGSTYFAKQLNTARDLLLNQLSART
jgi:HAMP domain-containing protein